MKKLYTCLYIFGCPVLWKTQQWRVPLPLSGSVHWVWQKNCPRCHCTVNRNEGKRQRKSDSSWMSNKKEEMYSGREKKKKQEHKEIKKVRKKGKNWRWKLRKQRKKEKKKKAKYQWIPAVFATIWAQNVTEAYPNPRSNKKSKGQNYLEFQLHINVSCIL